MQFYVKTESRSEKKLYFETHFRDMRSKKADFSGKSKKVIMIVDDDSSIRSSLSSLLEKEYEVVGMDNGPDALRYFKETRSPDLVVLDMEIPKLNGRVFVRRIKFDPIHNKVPVVLISSVNSRLIITSFLKLGVMDYIVKPFQPEDLVQKIVDIIDPR